MEYKYFTQMEEGYQLKKNYRHIYVISVLLVAFGLLLFYGGKNAQSKSFYLIPIGMIVIGLALIFFRNAYSVIISSQTRTVTVKNIRGTKSYPFNEFLNFQTVRHRVNGITTNFQVSMFFNENGRNRTILLGIVYSQKRADKLIDETRSLLASR